MSTHSTALAIVDDSGFGFAPPPFKPEEALQRLRRELRELGLSEREGRFERRGLAIARLTLEEAALRAETVRAPSRLSPQWQARVLRSSADVRDFSAQLKRQLAVWSDTDD